MFDFYIPTRILFGRGALSRVKAADFPGSKALIVTTAGQSVKKFGYLERLEKILDESGIGRILFDRILPNPVLDHVTEGAALAKSERCDFVIGLGGGSSIDSAKAIAVMAANPGNYWDYTKGSTGKQKPLANDPLPIVAITTTAGTGTEADPWTVITKTDTREKVGFGTSKTFPVLSVVDPELMTTVPPRLTAFQGFDALFHSTEGYLNVNASPMSDIYAEKSIELIGKSLARAVTCGTDLDAREDVALANTLAGMVESVSGCISEHSLEHAMSAFRPELPHGAGLIMISSAYYSHLAASGVCDKRLIRMAKLLGKTDAESPADFAAALEDLARACGVADLKMSDYGFAEADLPALADNARETMGCLFTEDPVPLSREDCIRIYQKSFR